MTASEAQPILQVRDVEVEYGDGLRAVAGVSLDVGEGEIVGIVGESGCGKSTLARAILQLPRPTRGTVTYAGTELTTLSPRQLRETRTDLQMVFQDPVTSLHPRRTVREVIAEPLVIWKRGTRAERERIVEERMREVGLDPEIHGDRRPAELSGGQCQRVAIARALAAGARVLVCDEPISSLDVSLRATVLNLLEDLRAQRNLSVLFIAHDLAVVRNISDRVMVMYLGRVCESGPAAQVFADPQHPYTRALIASVPTVDHTVDGAAEEPALLGDPPSPHHVPSGCRFRTRCPLAQDICAEVEPQLRTVAGSEVACHLAGEGLTPPR